MAEENTATSSHLDSYMHVYDNGTTARLYVTPWDRNTVADGYWQTVNTIQPLINRDIYLADALDKLAAKYTVYSAGFGVNITYNEPGDNFFISVDVDDILHNIPRYNFDGKFFKVSATEGVEGSKDVYMNLKEDGYISADIDEKGIFCNIDKMLYNTSGYSSVSSVSSNQKAEYRYAYKVSNTTIVTSWNFPDEIHENSSTIYLIG